MRPSLLRHPVAERALSADAFSLQGVYFSEGDLKSNAAELMQ